MNLNEIRRLLENFDQNEKENVLHQFQEIHQVGDRKSTFHTKKGDIFSLKNIRTYRPDLGLNASYYLDLINKKAPFNISKNKPLSKNLKKILKF